MALRIVEFFGYAPLDGSQPALEARRTRRCPFIGSECTKLLGRDGEISGVCTVKQARSGPIIICPNRLYAGQYRILSDIAEDVFGREVRLVTSQQLEAGAHDGRQVVVFGQRWGKELRLPTRGRGGNYFVDWVLALIGVEGNLQSFVAVEVQSMDTTGSYRAEREAYLREGRHDGYSRAGINWENVSKRILPQIIYKGHVLRRERLCTKGLFFVCPAPVYDRIADRLGRNMMEYTNLQPGSLTFRWYDPGPEPPHGTIRALDFQGQFSTTVDQVALAFTSPVNLPKPNVYEEAIITELRTSLRSEDRG